MLEKTSVRILKEKSKDIRVLSFFSYSLLRSENWEGFSDIWDGLGVLIERNYDALYPDRDRGKQMAFQWLANDRFTALLEEKKPSETDYEHISRMLTGLTKLKPVLEQKFKDGSPFPSTLFAQVQKWERLCKPKPRVEAPPPQHQAPKEPEAGSASKAQSTPAEAAGGSAQAVSEPMDTPKQAQGIVRKAALFLIEKENTRPMGYRCLRAVRWDVLEKTPPSDGGKTQLPAPNAQQRAYFQKLLAGREWKTVLEKAEAAFASGANHCWLDLQRFVASACRELGAEFSDVRKAVVLETAMLLERIPELPSLSFSDGSPFCDETTNDWIHTEVSAARGAPESASSVADAPEDPLVEERRNVNQFVSAGQMEEALALIQNGMRSSTNERDNFRRTITVGTLLLRAGQPDLAVSALESLDRKIDLHGLEKWDPDLAVEAWAALAAAYKVVRAQKPQNIQAAIQEKQNEILSKISRIDPRRAFNLSK